MVSSCLYNDVSLHYMTDEDVTTLLLAAKSCNNVSTSLAAYTIVCVCYLHDVARISKMMLEHMDNAESLYICNEGAKKDTPAGWLCMHQSHLFVPVSYPVSLKHCLSFFSSYVQFWQTRDAHSQRQCVLQL